MLGGSSYSKPQGGGWDIGSSQISNNKKLVSNTPETAVCPLCLIVFPEFLCSGKKRHPWVRRGNRVPCCTCCTCLETNGKVNFRCNWPRGKRHEDRFEVFLVPCLWQKAVGVRHCVCQFCWDEWGDLVVIENQVLKAISIPIESMYGIFTYIYHKNHLNVGKYTYHTWILWFTRKVEMIITW